MLPKNLAPLGSGEQPRSLSCPQGPAYPDPPWCPPVPRGRCCCPNTPGAGGRVASGLLCTSGSPSSLGMAGTRFGGLPGKGKAEKYPLRGVREEGCVHAGDTREPTVCPPRPPGFPPANTLEEGISAQVSHLIARPPPS